MDLEGYTQIPETLPEAQAMIVSLVDALKVAARVNAETLRVANEATAMIEAGRKALNSIEAPPKET